MTRKIKILGKKSPSAHPHSRLSLSLSLSETPCRQKRRPRYLSICLAKRNLLRRKQVSSGQKRSRPCQMKRVRKKKILVGHSDRFLPNKVPFDQKKFRSAGKCIVRAENVWSDQKKSRPKQTKLFLGKRNFVRQKENIFSEKEILSGQNKTFSGQKRFCPAKTRFFPRKRRSFEANEVFFAAA